MEFESKTLPTPSRLRRSYSDRAAGLPKIPTRFGMAPQVFNKAMSYNKTTSDAENNKDDQNADGNNNNDPSKLKRTVILIQGRKRLQSVPQEDNCTVENFTSCLPLKDNNTIGKSRKFNRGYSGTSSFKDKTRTQNRLSAPTYALDPFINDQDTSKERIQVKYFLVDVGLTF